MTFLPGASAHHRACFRTSWQSTTTVYQRSAVVLRSSIRHVPATVPISVRFAISNGIVIATWSAEIGRMRCRACADVGLALLADGRPGGGWVGQCVGRTARAVNDGMGSGSRVMWPVRVSTAAICPSPVSTSR